MTDKEQARRQFAAMIAQGWAANPNISPESWNAANIVALMRGFVAGAEALQKALDESKPVQPTNIPE